jgi:hypothetical protein
MKISINPMAQIVKRAERRINLNRIPSPIHAAHDRKRREAEQVLAGKEPTIEFFQAAGIEGLSATELAKRIVAKPDSLMQADNERRKLILRVRNAKTAQEIESILQEEGIFAHPGDKIPQLLEE